ncbi:hypothetical protein [Aureivirga sp. CE67]|uniref:hypothetical protein n=1 Tax=Aureivirga sp. CE67 TaxID=1788983 RepID=UPI0018CBD6E9|nr:hypothetical protein [Aureivirga sp. CE67]
MKVVFRILVVVFALGLAIGFTMKHFEIEKNDVVIGISMLGIAFILIPLFLYIRLQGKDLTKYSFKHNPNPEELDKNTEEKNSSKQKE